MSWVTLDAPGLNSSRRLLKQRNWVTFLGFSCFLKVGAERCLLSAVDFCCGNAKRSWFFFVVVVAVCGASRLFPELHSASHFPNKTRLYLAVKKKKIIKGDLLGNKGVWGWVWARLKQSRWAGGVAGCVQELKSCWWCHFPAPMTPFQGAASRGNPVPLGFNKTF